MKFGVREICDVVLKAKSTHKIGNKVFFENEPVLYFDTLKTSSLEGAATTVYAQGGKGNARLMAWEGERTLTFTMEDALISPAGFSILSGAGLIDTAQGKTIVVHATEKVKCTVGSGIVTATLSKTPHMKSGEDTVYVMRLNKAGEVISEAYIPTVDEDSKTISLSAQAMNLNGRGTGVAYNINELDKFADGDLILVDYYY